MSAWAAMLSGMVNVNIKGEIKTKKNKIMKVNHEEEIMIKYFRQEGITPYTLCLIYQSRNPDINMNKQIEELQEKLIQIKMVEGI